MFVSLNELDSATRKAFRGAGYHWGEAEEAGKAALWLAARGLDPLPSILHLLGEVQAAGLDVFRPRPAMPSGLKSSLAICPVCAGILIADDASNILRNVPPRLDAVISPLLLVPFLDAASSVIGNPLSAAWSGFRGQVENGRVEVSKPGAIALRATAVLIGRADTGGPDIPRADIRTSVQVEQGEWNELNRLAARTYVPASENSRQKGAGAGKDGND